jgi:uncharacterized phiE125 gp8 family phage protein
MNMRQIETDRLSIDLHAIKSHCRISHDDDDELLELYAIAAAEQLERDTRLAIRRRTYTGRYNVADTPRLRIDLPRGPFHSAVVSAVDAGGAVTLIDPENVSHDGGVPGALTIDPIPDGTKRLHVTFVAGYEVLPATIRLLIFALVAHWELHREAVTADGTPKEVPLAYSHIVRSLDPMHDGVL